jgi:hypothetical protein
VSLEISTWVKAVGIKMTSCERATSKVYREMIQRVENENVAQESYM